MGSHPPAVAMRASLLLSVLSLASAQVNLEKHDLPQLFAYDHGSHAVAVYRGAALKAAIAAGLVKGFPGSGSGAGGAGGDGAGREGRVLVAAPTPAPTPAPTLPPTPAPTLPPAPVCCTSHRLSQELDNMKRQLAALQRALAAVDGEVMARPMCGV